MDCKRFGKYGQIGYLLVWIEERDEVQVAGNWSFVTVHRSFG